MRWEESLFSFYRWRFLDRFEEFVHVIRHLLVQQFLSLSCGLFLFFFLVQFGFFVTENKVKISRVRFRSIGQKRTRIFFTRIQLRAWLFLPLFWLFRAAILLLSWLFLRLFSPFRAVILQLFELFRAAILRLVGLFRVEFLLLSLPFLQLDEPFPRLFALWLDERENFRRTFHVERLTFIFQTFSLGSSRFFFGSSCVAFRFPFFLKKKKVSRRKFSCFCFFCEPILLSKVELSRSTVSAFRFRSALALLSSPSTAKPKERRTRRSMNFRHFHCQCRFRFPSDFGSNKN